MEQNLHSTLLRKNSVVQTEQNSGILALAVNLKTANANFSNETHCFV